MRNLFLTLLIFMIISVNAYALDTGLLNMRNKIFNESKELQSILANSRDVVLVSDMWSSCIMAATQVDAYIYMQGIFNAVKKDGQQEEAINYLINWLNIIKNTSELNIKSLDSATQIFENATTVHMGRLRDLFAGLNSQVGLELNKVYSLKQSLKK